jgi:uncharacterized delta-60 repeat protein
MQPSRTRTRPPASRRLWLENLEARDVPAVVGTLDPTFATAGKVTTDLGYTPAGVAVDSVGRVVVVGTVIGGAGGTQDFAVTRFNKDGTLDTSFGTGGKATIDFTAGGTHQDDTVHGVAIAAGDAVVVVGETGLTPSRKFAVAELDSTGKLVSGFGTGGEATFNVGSGVDDAANAVAVNPTTGAIVVVGSSGDAAGNTRFGGGELDASGKLLGTERLPAVTGGTGKEDVALAVTFDGQGRIVVAGQSRNTTTGNLQASVFRLTSTGDPDAGFGMGGSAAVNGGPPSGLSPVARAVGTDAAGNVYLGLDVIAGGTSADQLAVARLTSAGVVDANYGNAGVFLSPLQGGGGQPGIVGLAVKPSGRVVAAGSSEVAGGTNLDLLVLQVDPSGKLDTSFDAAGKTPGALFIDFAGNNDAARGFAIDAGNGRVVVAGTDVQTNKAELARVITTVERPADLSVGGSATGTAKVYAPAGGQYANPPTATTPASVFGGFAGDVRTATGDVNGDGFPDTIMVTGPGIKTVMAVVSGKDNSVLLAATDPFGDPNFTFGGFVAAGDIDGDGRAEWVVTPELRGGPRVVIFKLLADGSFDLTSPGQPSLVANFFGIGDPSFRDGDRAALGDVNGDGILDVFSIAAFNGGPRTALYNGADVLVARAANRDPHKLVGDFFAAPSGQDEGRGGRSIAVGDVNGDGVADLIVTGDNLLGTGNQVVVFSGADLAANKLPGFGATPLANFTVGGQPGSALVSLAAVDLDGDNKADLAVGSGAGQASRVKVYLGTNLSGTSEPASTSLDPFGTPTANGVFVG